MGYSKVILEEFNARGRESQKQSSEIDKLAVKVGMKGAIPAHGAVCVGNVRRSLEEDLNVVVTSVDEDVVRVTLDRYVGGFNDGFVKKKDLQDFEPISS